MSSSEQGTRDSDPTSDDDGGGEMSSSEQGAWDSDPTSDDDDGGSGGGAMDEARRVYKGTYFISHDEFNMTNCWRECLSFFEHLKSMHFRVVIAFWMMAGYIRVGSIEASYRKGFDILFDWVHKQRILKLSDTQPGMIELAESSSSSANANANCRHPGSCFKIKQRWFDLIRQWRYNAQHARLWHKYPRVVLWDEDEILRCDEKPRWSINDAYFEWLPKITRVVLSEVDMLSTNGGVGGSTYFVAFNPMPDSLNPLLQNASCNPSMLLLRGLPGWSLPSGNFFLDRGKTLIHLEISGSTRLTPIHLHAISRLSHLEYLNLSGLPIQELPRSFFLNLTQLCWLILRGCCELLSLDLSADKDGHIRSLDVSHCTSLQKVVFPLFYEPFELDLSYTPLDPMELIVSTYGVTHLYVRGSTLECLSSIPMSHRVQVLDLSGSSCLTKLNDSLLSEMTQLVKIDLSWTKVKHLPSFANHNRLLLLSLQGLELESIETLSSLPNQLIELNLTGVLITSSQEFFKLDFLESLKHLQFLNLSQTSVAKLPVFLSNLVALKELLLANCQCLNVVPDLQALTKLVTLDLSLPNDSSSSNNRQLDFETKAHHLFSSFPLPRSIKKLILTNRSGIQKLFRLTTFDTLNLEILDLRGTDVTDWESKLEPQQSPQETIPKPTEIHVVFANHESNCHLPSSSLDVAKVFIMLISNIRNNVNSDKTQEQLEMLSDGLWYIQENYDRLKSSSNWKSGKDLLQELMDAATNSSTTHFTLDSADIKQLLRIVVKLKLLVPRKQMDESKASKVIKQKKKNPLFKRSQSQSQNQNQEDDGITNIGRGMERMEPHLLNSYRSLTSTQKKCLLCFSIFPYNEDRDKNTCVLKSIVIKKKILIYWWVGEGFIDLQNPDPNPHTTSNPHQEMMTSREIEAGSNGVKKPKTIEEIGKQILKVLVEKGFIKPVMKKGRESGSYCIHPSVLSFVIEQAKEEGFFDFDHNSNKLTPYFTRSKRACLLNPHARVPSSCQLWANYCSSPNKVKRFESVKTLFNVNDSMIDVKREWFSKMKNLHVLHLGIWGSENKDLIEVNDQTFLEDLQKMRQLRFLSLQGLPTIIKLPDSICHLKNLIILDLKDCSYLEELPVDIGSLKCLTHLDISSCPLIYKLPMGISFLSKLEVLKGLVISKQHAAHDTANTKWCGLFSHQKNEACTFRDLLKLERLRELSIIVNIFNFPEDNDLKVLREMKKLCKLKILWQRSISSEDVTTASGVDSSTRPARWQNKLTFWKHQQCQKVEEEDDKEESKPLESIEKLEMWCFPYESAPRWLDPMQLKNLKKLYIVGGNLRKFPGSGTDESRWNVETLRLKHLRNLDIEWPELKTMFPKLMYLETVECARHDFFPCNSEGVWRPRS